MARKPVRNRHRFTAEECRRGYQTMLARAMQDAALYGWFYRKVRGHYRQVRRSHEARI